MALDYGIDRLSESEIAQKFNGKNLAVLTHSAAKTKTGIHLIDFLHQKFQLKKIFAPEHGLRTLADDWIEDGTDESTGLSVISLYKRGAKAPRAEDLQGIDAIVIDLQDVGVRYYTYFSTIAEVMKATAPLNVEVILLDRPNLLGGEIVEGKVLDEELAGNFISYHTVPTRHGMTLGELALMINEEKKIGSRLTIIPVFGWKRENILALNERPWISPSPALTEITQVRYYNLWGTMENFNLSVGRGKTNELAFKVIGSPWITPKESIELARQLNELKIEGAVFTPVNWKVTRAIYEGSQAFGVQLKLNDKEIRSDELTYKVSSVLSKMFPERLTMSALAPNFYGSKQIVNSIKSNIPWEDLQSSIDLEIENFKQRRAPYLLY
jgi:uncharacterized protein YbbC (DUF1343 family)